MLFEFACKYSNKNNNLNVNQQFFYLPHLYFLLIMWKCAVD